MKLQYVAFFVYVFLFAACNAENPIIISPSHPNNITTVSIPPTPVNTSTPVLTITPFPPITETPFSSFYSTLPSGEYFVEVASENNGNCSFNYYSLNGQLASQQHFDKCGVLSSSGKYLAIIDGEYPDYRLSILDLTKNTTLQIPEANGCMHPSWSPDETKLALSCNFKDIFVLSLLDKSLIQLTTWSIPTEEDTWDFPIWSPDGKWIAYNNLPDFQRSQSDGVYITNVSCLSEPLTCKDKTIGTLFPYGKFSLITWSPDSKFIAVSHEHKGHSDIRTYNIITKSEQTLIELPDLTVDGLSWSPSGKWIVCSQYGTIFLLSPDGTQITKLKTEAKNVSFWMSFPPKNTGIP